VSAAAFRAMLLGFVRDRGALVMGFVVPAVFFLVFAAVFTGASGAHLRLTVATADEVASEDSRRLLAAVSKQPAVAARPVATAAEAAELVRRGEADVGLVVRAGAEPLGSLGGFGRRPLLLLVDPSKAVAAPMVAGLVQRAYTSALPDVALRGVAGLLDEQFVALTDEQRGELEASLADLRARTERAETPPSVPDLGDLFEQDAVAGRAAGQDHVAYYAGAVAVLFLFLSLVHGALSLQEERDSRLLDRLLAGPGSIGALLDGKLAFLALQGAIQVSVIFLMAWLIHGVDLPGRALGFAVVTGATTLAAAALALALVAACGSRRQAQTVANVAVLIVSALGGSMVPRFFMPPLLQQVGWVTPTTWALEAYTSVFWREEPLAALGRPVALLLATAAAAHLVARRLARRWAVR
jgi:ABC-2 type transport system permease protein